MRPGELRRLIQGELIHAIREHRHTLGELGGVVREGGYLGKTDFEIVEAFAPRRIRFALFDHDGTVSTLRQGWQAVMEPMMVRAILGQRVETAEAGALARIQSRVRAYIEESSGLQTLLQMDALAAMVQEFGLAPETERLDGQGYKEVFSEVLLAMVEDRVARIRRGELAAQDFIIKGAVELLKELRRRGVTLYLASGTDEADVINEARALGYLDLFNGGVVGARPGSRRCTKGQVIESVLESDPGGKGAFLVVGDGPVEIQQARRHGGIALGLASHEERRFGLNPAKRRRLIQAGAHAIVPDYSQWRHWLSQVIEEGCE